MTFVEYAFQYRVISYGASLGSDGRLWDTFDAYIGAVLVFRDDRGEGRPPGSQGVGMIPAGSGRM